MVFVSALILVAVFVAGFACGLLAFWSLLEHEGWGIDTSGRRWMVRQRIGYEPPEEP